MNDSPAWHVYILRNRLNALYTGISTDVERRLLEHAGTGRVGAKSLRARGPLELEYSVRLGSRALASQAEYRIKQLTKAAKESLIGQQPGAGGLLELLGIEVNEEESV